MATLTIRNLDETVKTRLRVAAATHGQSMEEEARQILSASLVDVLSDAEPLGTMLVRIFGGLGGDRFELPTREFDTVDRDLFQ